MLFTYLYHFVPMLLESRRPTNSSEFACRTTLYYISNTVLQNVNMWSYCRFLVSWLFLCDKIVHLMQLSALIFRLETFVLTAVLYMFLRLGKCLMVQTSLLFFFLRLSIYTISFMLQIFIAVSVISHYWFCFCCCCLLFVTVVILVVWCTFWWWLVMLPISFTQCSY